MIMRGSWFRHSFVKATMSAKSTVRHSYSSLRWLIVDLEVSDLRRSSDRLGRLVPTPLPPPLLLLLSRPTPSSCCDWSESSEPEDESSAPGARRCGSPWRSPFSSAPAFTGLSSWLVGEQKGLPMSASRRSARSASCSKMGRNLLRTATASCWMSRGMSSAAMTAARSSKRQSRCHGLSPLSKASREWAACRLRPVYTVSAFSC
mmetsp:Transcript_7196/g.18565  ORF Transcript_7196/g.18565 Transcript_7196/m.18565 type:complete len:204 (-) Transcript_7196:654-1265(-)